MMLAMLEATKMELATQSILFNNSMLIEFDKFYLIRDECDQRGGTNEGSCAEGYGVCCTCKYFRLKFNSNVKAEHD